MSLHLILSAWVTSNIFPTSNSIAHTCSTNRTRLFDWASKYIYRQNDILSGSQDTHRAYPSLTRPLPRHSNTTVHGARQTKTTLPPGHIPLRSRQPLSQAPPPSSQERILPATPAPQAIIRAREALLGLVRSPEGRMQICHFPGAPCALGWVYAGDSGIEG